MDNEKKIDKMAVIAAYLKQREESLLREVARFRDSCRATAEHLDQALKDKDLQRISWYAKPLSPELAQAADSFHELRHLMRSLQEPEIKLDADSKGNG